MEWINTLNEALQYIESHIADDLCADQVSEHIFCSSFHFQRVFSLLTGLTIGEYIRNRRMSLAGSELLQKHVKVIDVALKYGYETPESFSKAFTRFHGITPSSAKRDGAPLRHYAPLTIKIILEGGHFMDYRIENKPSFDILAMTRRFHMDSSQVEIPKFWQEFFSKGYGAVVSGWYGVCHNASEGNFSYSIADPYTPQSDIPEGFEKISVPEYTWAIFTCVGPMPHAIQDAWKKIYSEWLPSSEYELVPGYDFEYYTGPNTQDADYISEIWIPVKSKQA